MQWRGLWSLIVIAIVITVCGAEKKLCKISLGDGQVTVFATEGRCWMKWCDVGTTVRLSCRRRLQLFGPAYVTCEEDGWSTDIKRAQCKRAKDISDIRAKTAPTVSLSYFGVKIPSLTDSVVNLTTVHWSEVGWQFTASCQTQWTNDITDVELPKLYTKWFKIASDGSQVPVAQQVSANVWSRISPAENKTELIVNEFQEPGNYTFKCTVSPWQWHPWSPLHATVEVRVTKTLCPTVEPPCNTHVVGPITEQNKTENSILRFWPDPGWASMDGHPLKTKCVNSDWDPPISWLSVERVKCPPLDLQIGAGVSKRLLDGPWDNHFGSWYELSCTNHLTALKGFPRVYCNSSGMWDPDPTLGTVKKISCVDPSKVPSINCDCPDHDHSTDAVCKCNNDNGSMFDSSDNKTEWQSNGWWPPVNNHSSPIPCQCKDLPHGWKLYGEPSDGSNKEQRAFCKGVVIQVASARNLTVRGTFRCEGEKWNWIN